ncbi:molybdenum cofactor guanylyltransferase [Candidatus Magnetominusculus xianensis]|uniref:Probable molybdenum cofactor guanylyltransferase n=1 Tax=Candidatus Magnetominusculus xianensis TaxID=1748249 RepID=A0ABR5SIQ8_9BACT|nr:molybdenum cofactor guanylyltransferase [Candidatus Magnetominusculus xianensis]KWT92810.1 putative molybdenum cofactor guanylyltransferase [Candidatus Magnetominusculus xianensis]MBF0403398.1 molybdenum cofactor guanylyltransferase [Nitrospirota bacterium]
MVTNISGVVLAGGENKRFPSLKAFIEIGGQTIIDRNLHLLAGFFDEIIISTNQPDIYFPKAEILIGDVLTEKGPATGILSCLLNCRNDRAFFVACDMPFVKEELIALITSYPEDYDAVVPLYLGRPQPLAALYHKRIVPMLEKSISNGVKSLAAILKTINVRYVEEELVQQADSAGLSFININTPEDLLYIDNRH